MVVVGRLGRDHPRPLHGGAVDLGTTSPLGPPPTGLTEGCAGQLRPRRPQVLRCGGLWSHQVAVLYYAGGRRERETTAAIHARQGHDGGPAEVAPGQPPVCAVALSTRRHAHRRPGEAGGFDAERQGTAPPHAEELHGGDGTGRPGTQNPPSPLGQWLALGSRTPIPVGGLGSCGRVAPNDGGDTNNTADLNHPVGRRTVGASRPTHGPGAGEAHA